MGAVEVSWLLIMIEGEPAYCRMEINRSAGVVTLYGEGACSVAGELGHANLSFQETGDPRIAREWVKKFWFSRYPDSSSEDACTEELVSLGLPSFSASEMVDWMLEFSGLAEQGRREDLASVDEAVLKIERENAERAEREIAEEEMWEAIGELPSED